MSLKLNSNSQRPLSCVCKVDVAHGDLAHGDLAARASALTALLGVAQTMFPDNVVAAAVNMNILGVITFSLFFGLCLSQLGPQADGLVLGIQVGRHTHLVKS